MSALGLGRVKNAGGMKGVRTKLLNGWIRLESTALRVDRSHRWKRSLSQHDDVHDRSRKYCAGRSVGPAEIVCST